MSGSIPGPAGTSLLPLSPRCLSTPPWGEGFGGSVMWGAGGLLGQGLGEIWGLWCHLCCPMLCRDTGATKTHGFPCCLLDTLPHTFGGVPPPLIGCILGPGAHPNPSPPFGVLAPLQSISPLLRGAAAPPIPLHAPPSPRAHHPMGSCPSPCPPGPPRSHFLALREGAQLLSNSLASPPASSAI